jgi:hypothetical protein
VSDG